MTERTPSSGAATLPDEVRQTARLWNFDFYLAATLAPSAAQRDLMALAAFAGELDRIRLTLSEPALAQIRIQWWRDELRRMDETGTSDHPIGAAVLAALRTHDLPIGLLLGVADAVADQVSEPLLSDEQKLAAWFGKRFGGAIALSGRCLQVPIDAEVVTLAARSYGLARLVGETRDNIDVLERLGVLSSVEELHQTADAAIATVKSTVRDVPRTARVALLPASVAGLYIASANGTPGPLATVCRMASAHWLGRF